MAQLPPAGVRVSHVAVAVSDLEASIRFYTEGFGFEPGPLFESGDEVAAVSEVEPPVRMASRYLTKDGFRLELMGWETPAVHGSASQTRNQRGLTHLSFEVDDIASTEARLLELGGVVAAGCPRPSRPEAGGDLDHLPHRSRRHADRAAPTTRRSS